MKQTSQSYSGEDYCTKDHGRGGDGIAEHYFLSIFLGFSACARLAGPSDMVVPGRVFTTPSLSMICKSPLGRVSTGLPGFVGRDGVGLSMPSPAFSRKRRTNAMGGVSNAACHHGITRKRSIPRNRVLSQGTNAMAPPATHAASCPMDPHFRIPSARILAPAERKITWMKVKAIPNATFIPRDSARFQTIASHECEA